MERVYHLGITRADIRGAKTVLLPGDPARVPAIASAISGRPGRTPRPTKLAEKREFTTYLCTGPVGKKVLVTSTGIGGPSASIAIDELARLGVTTFIRVGTTGALQSRVRIGDVVITTGSVRLDGASTHYAPIEYPAVADHDVTAALVRGAKSAGVRCHVGVTASSDTFYHGEERGDSFRKYTIRALSGSAKEWQALHVLNFEMESSTVLTLTASMGLRGGCISGVVNRAGTGSITARGLKLGEKNVIAAAAAALKHL